jgi:hypothetical protein
MGALASRTIRDRRGWALFRNYRMEESSERSASARLR